MFDGSAEQRFEGRSEMFQKASKFRIVREFTQARGAEAASLLYEKVPRDSLSLALPRYTAWDRCYSQRARALWMPSTSLL